MDTAKIKSFIEGLWDAEIVPELVEYIRIPNKSPMFDPKWVEAKLDRLAQTLDEVLEHAAVEKRPTHEVATEIAKARIAAAQG